MHDLSDTQNQPAVSLRGVTKDFGKLRAVSDLDLEIPRGSLYGLALATRLEVEEDDEDRWLAMPDDDPRGQAHDIYQWVGFLQETLVDALTEGGRRG
jgi:hypothetical protein